MPTTPKLRRNLIVGGIVFAFVATPSFALFGLGDIVFDPTAYAELITQATTAYSHYKAFVSNVQHFTFKQGWQTEKIQLQHIPIGDLFGETDDMDTAITHNDPTAAEIARYKSTQQLNDAGTVYVSGEPTGGEARSQLAMVEASDASSIACMNAVGAYNAAIASNAQAEQDLKTAQMDDGDDTNSEVQQLNLVNAAQAQQLVEMKQQGMLHACLAQQMAVSNMQQRNAAANDLNTKGFIQQEHQTNNAYSTNGSDTWTTYIP